MTKSRAREAAFALLALSLGVLASLALVEVGVRLLVDASRWRFRDATHDWQLDARLGWKHKADLDVTTVAEQGWVIRFRTNADGVTPSGAVRARTPGVRRIMIFGDSAVVGRSVPQDLTVSALLEQRLRARGLDVEVINAGVEGYATDQSLLRMEQLLPLYRPDLVLHGICDNDFGGNLEARGKPHFTVEADGALREHPPVGVLAFGTSGPRAWIQHSAAYRLLQPRLLVLRARLGGWQQRNLLGLAPSVYYDPAELERCDWRLFGALVARMKSSAEQHAGPLALYLHPAIAETWAPYIRSTIRALHIPEAQYDRHALERRVRATAATVGVDFIPLIEAFERQPERGPFHLLPRDPHCNPQGYAIQAEVLAEYVMAASAAPE